MRRADSVSSDVVQSICGDWEFESMRRGSTGSRSTSNWLSGLLSAKQQRFSWKNNKLVLSSRKTSLNRECTMTMDKDDVIPCPAGEENALRMEHHDNGENHVVDERRVIRNGTRMEQTLYITPKNGITDVQVRIFKRADADTSWLWGSMDHKAKQYSAVVLLCVNSLAIVFLSWEWVVSLLIFYVWVCIFLYEWVRQTSLSKKGEDKEESSELAKLNPGNTVNATETETEPLEEKETYKPFVRVDSVDQKQRGFMIKFCYQVVAFDGSMYTKTFKSYKSICEFHRLVCSIVESSESKKSFFTRRVPCIPPPMRYSRLALTGSARRSQAERVERQFEAIRNFFEVILGEKSDPVTRKSVLEDHRVRDFLGIS